MVYDPNIPAPTDLLSDSQADIQENFSQANVLFNADHIQFSDPTDGGEHRKITYNDNLVADPSEVSPKSALYPKALTSGKGDLFYQNNNAATDVRRVMWQGAWARFVPRNTDGACTINKSENITSITRTGVGIYGVVFTNPFEDDQYGIHMTANIEGIGVGISPWGIDMTILNAGNCFLTFYQSANLGARDPFGLAGRSIVILSFLGDLA